MRANNLNFRLLFLLIFFALTSCEEQRDMAVEYYKDKTQSENPPTNLERFGFDQKPTPRPTPKVVIPFDNERTRQDARSN